MVASYLAALDVFNLPLVGARTVATTVMLLVSLFLIIALEASGRRRSRAVIAVCVALAAVYVVVLIWSPSRSFFALATLTLAIALISAGGVAVTGLMLASDSFILGRSRTPEPGRVGSQPERLAA